VNWEESEEDEVKGMKKEAESTSKEMHVNERLVICNYKATDGQARESRTRSWFYM